MFLALFMCGAVRVSLQAWPLVPPVREIAARVKYLKKARPEDDVFQPYVYAELKMNCLCSVLDMQRCVCCCVVCRFLPVTFVEHLAVVLD